MAKKDVKKDIKSKIQVSTSTTATTTKATTATTTTTPAAITKAPSFLSELKNSIQISYKSYKSTNSKNQKQRLIDTFLTFLVFIGVLQFVFCLIMGNFPFNAFLGGFSSTVGQFVLTVGLRLQISDENKEVFRGLSPERAFGEFCFASLILHFVVLHFIN